VKWGGIDLLNSAMRHRAGRALRLAGLPAARTISVGTAVVVHQYSQQVGNVVASMAMHWNDLVRQKTEVADVDPISTARRARGDGRRAGRLAADPGGGSGSSTRRGPKASLRSTTSRWSLRRGQRIAVIERAGREGSLLRVLAGLVDAERVSIAVDGAPQPRLKHLGAISLLLPQDPRCSSPACARTSPWACATGARRSSSLAPWRASTSVISQLPQGFDTLISSGASTSREPEAAARAGPRAAAAKDAGLVLLDEATSSVDAGHRGGDLRPGDERVLRRLHRLLRAPAAPPGTVSTPCW